MIRIWLRSALHNNQIHSRLALAAFFLVISVLSGQFSLARIFPSLSEDLFRIRTLTLFIAIIGFWPLILKEWRVTLEPTYLAFVALCSYLLARGMVDHGDLGLVKAFDIIVIVLYGALAMIVARHNDLLRIIVISILFCAFLLLLIELWGQASFLTGKQAGFGFGWNSLIGAISFNRIEFLAFSILLSLLFAQYQSNPKWILVFIAFAIMTLFATWGSLQKSALIASVLGLVTVASGLVAKKKWKLLSLLVVLILLAANLTSQMFGSHIAGRFEGASKISFLDTPPKKIRVAAFAGVQHSDINSSLNYLKPLPHQNSSAKITVHYCYFKSATLQVRKPTTPVLCYDRSLTDRTGRLSLAIEALRGMEARPLFGHGLASYQVEFIHPEVFSPDTYLYPHNLFLEIGFEGGLIGLSLLCIIFLISLRALRNQINILVWTLPLIGFCVFMTISVLFSGDFYDSRLLWLPLFMLESWRTVISSQSP